eukprot:CAMPEP_0184343818 /NCGR_PEP_ID=MMETSP1089-20130417/12333_1 /TAXON_ID=38269 ORGANISM="Gloeochaete wittrockiana, Strain SAG46.84" /NCGR_SAMPLE_ID=MMETSP1089 /ASSEMBLY_ACC=CAM_ASM_000445 /LENGTH=44 /DNA_ID= /DNA_START= /DNA_END= /DNA_ORIENTATION=
MSHTDTDPLPEPMDPVPSSSVSIEDDNDASPSLDPSPSLGPSPP